MITPQPHPAGPEQEFFGGLPVTATPRKLKLVNQALHRSMALVFACAVLIGWFTLPHASAQTLAPSEPATPNTVAVRALPAEGQDAVGAESNQSPARPKPQEEARRTYMDRIVAAPMSHLGASWLVRPERQAEENAQQALQNLGLKPGMQVCDIGCGNGYWTLMLSESVGKEGKVYAVDIQPEMLRQLRTRAAKQGVKNIKPVLGAVDDPKIPNDARLDLILMVDVYHEFSHPESMLWAMHNALAPDGVIALLEYREEDPNVPIKPLHKMSKHQIMKEYQANGFKLVREYNELPWQHLMFFAREDSSLSSIEPVPFR